MSKNNRRKRNRAGSKRRRGCHDKSPTASVSEPAAPASGDNVDRIGKDSPGMEGCVLTQVIRAAAIFPLALLVILLASHPLYLGLIPQLFQPIVDKQVAVLTLTAGHAAIIGLLINNRGRFTWSTHALFVAGMATALAGFRTIGESTPGVVIALMLILLTLPAVWAETFSAVIRRAWRFARTTRGISVILLVAGIVGIVINQLRDENYIMNWILIPMGITAAFFISVGALWQLLKLSCRYGPPVFSSLRTRAAATFMRKSRRRRRTSGRTDLTQLTFKE